MASHNSSSNNVVGAHYRVGKKIGEGSFGVIFEGVSAHEPSPCAPQCHVCQCYVARGGCEHYADRVCGLRMHIGTNLLNSQTVAIKFVCVH